MCESFVSSVLEEGAPIDLRDADDQERIFANDIADRGAYYQRMKNINSERGDLERARDIEQWRQDPLRLAKGISRYLQGDRRENLIVVFDNVDRRDSAAQLAAFQTALWFMDQTRCLVVLQMRDSTFEAYKHEPPLDTYRTGQIFHISPPRFVDVVKKRLELSLEGLANEAPEQIKFVTRSGATINYPKSRAGEFLKGIYSELFQSRNNISRVLEALAGRNVRKALNMFMAIITSGHMPEDIIASVAQGVGYRTFPEYKIVRALMRQDYRFFNNNSGFISNILHCDNSWDRPSNLLVPEILFYLIGRRKDPGDNGQIGFVALPKIIDDMEAIGFVRTDIVSAAHFCLSKGLLDVETSAIDKIREQDAVKATASAWAHMRILAARVEYLYAILPSTPINDGKLTTRVFELMQQENRSGELRFQKIVGLVEGLEQFLRHQEHSMRSHPGYADMNMSGGKYILTKMQEALKYARNESAKASGQPDMLDF